MAIFLQDAESERKRLEEVASGKHFSPSFVDALLKSGWIHFIGRSAMDALIYDTFYGRESNYGLMPLRSLRNEIRRFTALRVTVRSVQEIVDYLSTHPITRWLWSKNLITFRGQDREFHTRREYPNPVLVDEKGAERLILPPHWRKFSGDFLSRHDPEVPSIFSEAGKEFVKGPLREVVESFSPDESYWHRYRGEMEAEFRGIDQHYGFPTTALDVTFDVPTAAFFSRHQFVKTGDRADYVPLPSNKPSVLYAFRFRKRPPTEDKPPVIATADAIRPYEIFERFPPLRPIRQRAALVQHGMYAINHAASDVLVAFELSPKFDMKDLPAKEWLFPSPSEDAFYAALLEEKRLSPDRLNDIVEYSFHAK